MNAPRQALGPRLTCGVWLLTLAALSWVLFTQHNRFPGTYHPDEPGKVRQITTGLYNFHHPLLLLTATRAVCRLGNVGNDSQAVVEAGRQVSAAGGALAVAALAFVAWRLRGMAGAVAAGLLLATHHQLFELSHYMKEDTMLLAGLALVFAALALLQDGITLKRAAALGAACGVAASGKYLGMAVLPVALGMLMWTNPARPGPRPHPGLVCSAFLTGLLAVLCTVNWPLLAEPATFRSSLLREVGFVVHGQKGMTRSVPNTEYLRAFVDNTTPALWLFLAWHLATFWRARRNRPAFEWLLLGFPFAFALGLALSPKSNDRYFLPATAGFTLLAALGALDCAKWLRHRWRWRGAAVWCITVALAANLFSAPQPLRWKTLPDYWRAFQHDDRAALHAWITDNLPADAVIAQDARVGMPLPDTARAAAGLRPLPQRVLQKKYVADLGSLDQLRARGVTHVIVSQSSYGRYFRKSLRPQDRFQEEFARHRAFYEQLFREGERLWAREYGTVIYLHPGLEVFELPKPARPDAPDLGNAAPLEER